MADERRAVLDLLDHLREEHEGTMRVRIGSSDEHAHVDVLLRPDRLHDGLSIRSCCNSPCSSSRRKASSRSSVACVEVAERQSATAGDRIADIERRLRRIQDFDTDRPSPQARQQRVVKTVRGVRISTSMNPGKMQSPGNLLSQTLERGWASTWTV